MADKAIEAQKAPKEKLIEMANKAKVKVGEFATRALTAEKTTAKVTRVLKETELQAEELSGLLRSQNHQVVQHTSAGHKAGVDVAGMALAVGIDLAVFEGLSVAAKWAFVANNRKWLSGAPHLLVGLATYGGSLWRRSRNPGFPSDLIEVGEETAKHLIVNGTTNMLKQYLAK